MTGRLATTLPTNSCPRVTASPWSPWFTHMIARFCCSGRDSRRTSATDEVCCGDEVTHATSMVDNTSIASDLRGEYLFKAGHSGRHACFQPQQASCEPQSTSGSKAAPGWQLSSNGGCKHGMPAPNLSSDSRPVHIRSCPVVAELERDADVSNPGCGRSARRLKELRRLHAKLRQMSMGVRC